MSNETKLVSQKNCNEEYYESKQRNSFVTVDSENQKLFDSSQEVKEIENLAPFQNKLFYRQFFQEKIKQTQITPALHKKAINWLITFCWTRNYSDEVLWYSVGYYYSYSFSYLIKKNRLTLILISAINLSLKLFNSDSALGFGMMKSLLNHAWSVNDLREVEQQFFQLFEFDLYFPTTLEYILGMKGQEQLKSRILFLAQCLFMNNYEVAINDFMLQEIHLLINDPKRVEDMRIEIIKLVKQSKFIDVIKQKYSSKFNIDHFIDQLMSENSQISQNK